jgi:hypothetical protein
MPHTGGVNPHPIASCHFVASTPWPAPLSSLVCSSEEAPSLCLRGACACEPRSRAPPSCLHRVRPSLIEAVNTPSSPSLATSVSHHVLASHFAPSLAFVNSCSGACPPAAAAASSGRGPGLRLVAHHAARDLAPVGGRLPATRPPTSLFWSGRSLGPPTRRLRVRPNFS